MNTEHRWWPTCSHHTLALKWRWQAAVPAAGDIDGDGHLELVAVTTSSLSANHQRDIIIAVRPNGSVVRGFPPNTTGASGCDDRCHVTGGFDQNAALGDVDGDGRLDIQQRSVLVYRVPGSATNCML